METLKEEVIRIVSKMPDTATIEDSMYELYVIDKIRKSIKAADEGETISTEDLKREIKEW